MEESIYAIPVKGKMNEYTPYYEILKKFLESKLQYQNFIDELKESSITGVPIDICGVKFRLFYSDNMKEFGRGVK